MPVQIVRPRSIGVASGGARRTILLTGAPGVVGRAVLGRLRDFDVVCLVHRSPVCGPDVTAVPGDVARAMFGLAEQAYVELAGRVDVVIHCAAVTDFNRTAGSLEATNVAGTELVAAFAAAANAVLYQVSTAFVGTTVDGDHGRTAIGYAASKLAAEQVVRSSGVPHVILRPSVVIGDSAMLEFFTTYLQSGQAKPSSQDQLAALGARPLPDQRESLRTSVQYWAAQRGYGQAQTGTEKAA
jgi:thioester reductase-like protein